MAVTLVSLGEQDPALTNFILSELQTLDKTANEPSVSNLLRCLRSVFRPPSSVISLIDAVLDNGKKVDDLECISLAWHHGLVSSAVLKSLTFTAKALLCAGFSGVQKGIMEYLDCCLIWHPALKNAIEDCFSILIRDIEQPDEPLRSEASILQLKGEPFCSMMKSIKDSGIVNSGYITAISSCFLNLFAAHFWRPDAEFLKFFNGLLLSDDESILRSAIETLSWFDSRLVRRFLRQTAAESSNPLVKKWCHFALTPFPNPLTSGDFDCAYLDRKKQENPFAYYRCLSVYADTEHVAAEKLIGGLFEKRLSLRAHCAFLIGNHVSGSTTYWYPLADELNDYVERWNARGTIVFIAMILQHSHYWFAECVDEMFCDVLTFFPE